MSLLKQPGATQPEDDEGHARLRDLVLQMEQKSAQLSALRRTHTIMTEKLDATREELARTRGALEETAEAAAARWRRIKKLEGASI